MDKLIELYKRLLIITNNNSLRYFHDKMDWNAHLIGVVIMVIWI
jgi:hypothetical protein